MKTLLRLALCLANALVLGLVLVLLAGCDARLRFESRPAVDSQPSDAPTRKTSDGRTVAWDERACSWRFPDGSRAYAQNEHEDTETRDRMTACLAAWRASQPRLLPREGARP